MTKKMENAVNIDVFCCSRVQQWPKTTLFCVVSGAFTQGSHVNADGFELSSAQNHGIYEVFSKNVILSALRAPRPKKG